MKQTSKEAIVTLCNRAITVLTAKGDVINRYPAVIADLDTIKHIVANDEIPPIDSSAELEIDIEDIF